MAVNITFEFQSRNNNETLTPSVTVFSKAGVVQTTGTATHSSNGRYYYDYSASSTGEYYAKFEAESRVVITDMVSVTVSSTSSSSTVTGYYCTTLELNEFMRIKGVVPDWQPGESPTLETVGAVAGNVLVYYLDQKNVINGTLTLSYGSSATSTTDLTETTDYTVDLDTGTITLTATGYSTCSGNNLYAEYSYNTIGVPDSVIRDFLDRAQKDIDRKCNTHFADGTDTTPDYLWTTKEYHEGKGEHRKDYWTKKYPLVELNATLDGDHTAAVQTLTVLSTAGFPTSGTATIESEQVTWTGKTSTTLTGVTRGANSSTAATHDDGTEVQWLVVEISRDDEAVSPTWITMEKDVDYSMDYNAGRLRLQKNILSTTTAVTTLDIMPLKGVPKRVRISYPYGFDTIPEDIKRANLMIASRDLMHSAARKALANGFADFNPNTLDVDNDWIETILAEYRSIRGAYI